MGVTNIMSTTGLRILVISLLCLSSVTCAIDSTFQSSLNSFSRNIFSELVHSNGQKSLIYSPFSIQSSLAMVRMGADGETAVELDRGLNLDNQTPETVADHYQSILGKYEKSDILKIANKIYASENFELQDNYTDVLKNKFFSSAENIDFSMSGDAANTINAWVESKTDKMIKNLVLADTFDVTTRSFLVSAIYFNGKWKEPFPKEDTEEADFYTDETNTVKVQMMKLTTTSCDFRQSTKLNAVVVRLAYTDSDLGMVIVLPKENTGLAAVQEKLKTFDLAKFAKKFKKNNPIEVHLPKFNIESKFDLKDVLQKMGMNEMFGNADFTKMFKSSDSFGIDKVIHKAVIDVSEEGTKAAAATGVVGQIRIGTPYPFKANHPFYYAIVNEDNVPLFEGTFLGA